MVKESFSVIGKGEGEGFIQRLWADANGHFDEVAGLAKKDADGNLAGVWGLMSDESRAFLLWEDFSTGLYLAGVEVEDGAQPPEGWVKWTVPGYRYAVFANDGPVAFERSLAAFRAEGFSLAGAVHDFTDPKTGKNEMYFPIRKRS